MSHTFTNLLTHVIFSTRERRPFLADEIRKDVFAYAGGIVRELGGTAIMVNGTDDHVHALLVVPGNLAVAECVRLLKTNTSRWVHEKWPERKFAWQTGYGAFSVSESNRGQVIRYIQDQEKHHRKISFQDEFRAFLRKQGIAFDERYIWG